VSLRAYDMHDTTSRSCLVKGQEVHIPVHCGRGFRLQTALLCLKLHDPFPFSVVQNDDELVIRYSVAGDTKSSKIHSTVLEHQGHL
jgi:hypothetical protein